MVARKPKMSMRSVVVDVPESEVMKLVAIAKDEGLSVREVASRKFTDLLRGIK
ncbi:hypothetical protein BH790_gp63 [Gordonia phage Gsput1]|uniref:Uncharacterized protein n=1 Tax=Gordonia phage Gsput1 TaxID=1622193 RepID=A0A0E3XA10_9CAUD|nr:hypothetical protein BH790_gp63 [Gordonia phage Gsput1]AKC03088.1 hypothetical protein Gsput1_63 [Gordonia phage Gsput1]